MHFQMIKDKDIQDIFHEYLQLFSFIPFNISLEITDAMSS